jgi:hypothetical protein
VTLRNQDRAHTNEEIDALLTERMALIRQAAASVCRHRSDELSHEVILLWFERYRKNPLKYWPVLADPCSAHVVRSCRHMALRVIEGWQRAEVAGELVEESDCAAVEWGSADAEERYAGGVRAREVGGHVASDDEVREMFAAVERRATGRVEGIDLWTAYRRAEAVAQEAIRYLASGYSRSEIGSKSAYNAARRRLQMALV